MLVSPPVHTVIISRTLQFTQLQYHTYRLHNVNNWCLAIWMIFVLKPGLLTHKCPQFIQVNCGTPFRVSSQVVISHTKLKQRISNFFKNGCEDVSALILISSSPPFMLALNACMYIRILSENRNEDRLNYALKHTYLAHTEYFHVL